MIRFTSPAAGSFSMMDADARRMIELMGHSPGTLGALAADEVAVALHRLRSATEVDRQQLRSATPAPGHRIEDEMEAPVSLSHRAFPLIDMLEKAQDQQKPVLWGM